MITLITGVPGSGKTLYGVSELLAKLVGQSIKVGDQDVERVIYSNVPGLLLDHELIDRETINTWHEWVKPGYILDLDEIQDFWPPRPNGSKVPPYIEALATHRHKGGDIIVRTQHPMMIDQNLRALVGRHLHIRRVGNLPAAVVYEWDHCSRQLLYSNAIAKAPWRFPRGAYKLYRSAEAHTKMPRKLPAILLAFPIAIAAGVYLAPRLHAAVTGSSKPASLSAPAAVTKTAPGPVIPVVAPYSPASAPHLPPLTPTPSAAVQFGCARLRNVCRCYDDKGNRHQVEAGVCEARIEPAVPALPATDSFFQAAADPQPVGQSDQAELELIAAVAKSAGRSSRLPGQ